MDKVTTVLLNQREMLLVRNGLFRYVKYLEETFDGDDESNETIDEIIALQTKFRWLYESYAIED